MMKENDKRYDADGHQGVELALVKLYHAGYMYSAMADLSRFSEAPEYAAVLDQLR